MSTTTIRVDRDLLQRIESLKPNYLSAAGFFQLLAEQALNGQVDNLTSPPLTIPLSPSVVSSPTVHSKAVGLEAVTSNAHALPVGLAEEGINRDPDRKPAKKKDPFASKNLPAELVPADLQQHADLVVGFWAAKKGTRSEGTWNRILTKLRGMTPADQATALGNATDAHWWTVYEPSDTPKQGKWKEQSYGIVPTPELSPAMQEWMNS